MKYKLLYCLLFLLFFGSYSTLAQKVSGIVTDAETGEPLAGVNVLVARTLNGTSTNASGEFELTISESADSLLFSFIGYKPVAIAIEDRSFINVKLQPTIETLQDLVVTAFGVEKEQRSLGYAVQQIDNEELTKAGDVNLVSALSGKIAGVQVINTGGAPGQGSRIILRGINSLDVSRDNQPLFVVDGVPIDNSTDVGGEGFDSRGFSNRAVDINPDDIASVNVLKGAAATVLYGVRAANGAIIITTKRGFKGRTQVSYSGTVALETVNRFPDIQQTYSQGFSGVFDTTSFWPSWGAPREEALLEAPNLKYYNNWKEAYDNGFKVDNNVNISGGGDKATFYASIGNTQQDGVLPFSNWDRTSVRLSGDVNVTEKFKFGGSINYINSGGDRVFADRFNERIIYWSVNQDVSDYRKDDGTMMGYYGSDDNSGTNPLYDAKYATYEDDVNRMIGNLNLNYTFTEWLDLSYRVGLDYYGDSREQTTQGPQGIPGENILSSTSSIGETRINSKDITSTISLHANKKVYDKLIADIRIGNDIFDRDYEQVFTYGSDFLIPNFYHFNNAQSVSTAQTIRKQRLVGVYGSLELNYDYMIYLNVAGRNDWTSTLPKDNRSFFYPSVNLGYVFTEMLDESDILSFGKVRISWAEVGKDAPPHVIGTSYSQPSAFPINGQSGFTRSNISGSPDLKPERTSTIEIGTNLKFMENRFDLDVSWYKANSKDQIIPIPLSPTTGYTALYANSGEIENKGLEIMLKANVLKSKDFDLNLMANFSKNKNKVISIRDGIDEIDIASQYGYAGSTAYIKLIEGIPYGSIFGTSYKRYYGPDEEEDDLYLDKDRPLLIGDDGFPVIDSELKILGNSTPDWIGGFGANVRYKQFELSALIDVSYGGDKYSQYNNFYAAFGIAKYTLDRNDMKVFDGYTSTGEKNTKEVWLGQGEGPDGEDYGAGFYRNTYRASTENSVLDASYIKLRNISLTYNLGSVLSQKVGFRNASVKLSASNLILWTRYDFWDPEVTSSGAGNNAMGLSGLAHPGVASYALTLKLDI